MREADILLPGERICCIVRIPTVESGEERIGMPPGFYRLEARVGGVDSDPIQVRVVGSPSWSMRVIAIRLRQNPRAFVALAVGTLVLAVMAALVLFSGARRAVTGL
jgi:hypothetical protein